jgi:hypothetical protein
MAEAASGSGVAVIGPQVAHGPGFANHLIAAAVAGASRMQANAASNMDGTALGVSTSAGRRR